MASAFHLYSKKHTNTKARAEITEFHNNHQFFFPIQPPKPITEITISKKTNQSNRT
jgi:hypothetical protein